MTGATDIIVQVQAIGIEVRDGARLQSGEAIVHIVVPAEMHTDDIDQRSRTEAVTYEIVQQGEEWVFSIWECAPGPCPDDFFARFTTREEAISAVVNYAIGGPTLLNGWVVPLHRHPELRLPQVAFAVSQAVTVDSDAFQRIEWQRHSKIAGNRLFGTSRWQWALQYQFLAVPHVRDAGLTLMLRRDAQEAYCIQGA